MIVEMWKEIKGTGGLYLISTHGRVFSARKGRVISKSDSSGKYKKVSLYVNGSKLSRGVHTIVANHFIQKIIGKNFVNHIDHCKSNNNISNLEWCTLSENNQAAYRIGANKKGEHSVISKIDESEARMIVHLLKRYTPKFVSIATDVNIDIIREIRRKRSWKDLTTNIIFPKCSINGRE